MQCEHTVRAGRINRQCKRTARAGFNLCDTHGWFAKYYICFTWQENVGDHWKDRKKGIWPILFPFKHAAEKHMNEVALFSNKHHHRKCTCSVERTKATFPQAQLRKVPK